MMTQEQTTEHRERHGDRRVSRRQFVKRAGATAGAKATVTAATVTAVTGVATASHAGTKPEHVNISADTDWLERYVPMLDLSAVPLSNRPTMFGWRVSSPEHDLEVGVYAAKYAVQDGWLKLTSHNGDREWIYVFVDSEGRVDHVSYTAYHWLRGYVVDPNVYVDGAGRHATFRVANKYHHYIPLPTTPENGILKSVSSLGDDESRSGPLYWWLDNGLEQALYPGAVHNPWLLDRDGPLDAWWSEESRLNRFLVDAWSFVGFGLGIDIRGSDAANLGDASV